MVDRISDLAKKKDISIAALEKAIGLSNGIIGKWRKQSPSCDKLKLVADYLNTTLDYLVYGEKNSSSVIELSADEQELLTYYSKLKAINKGKVIGTAKTLAELEAPVIKEPVAVEEPEEHETIFIEFSTLKVSAGSGEPLIDDSYPDFIEVKKSDLTENANFAVKVNGESMMPHFKNGDIVLVRSQPYVNIGEIGIFVIDGNGYIKERGDDRLISINPRYDDIYFEEGQDIRCKGLVIGTLEEDDFV